jgi:hypothetical protein
LISCRERRQWQRASIPVSNFSIRRENPHGDGNTSAAREGADMAVWFMRRLQCLPREQFILFHAEIARDAASVEIPTNDRRNNVLRTRDRAHALNQWGAMD